MNPVKSPITVVISTSDSPDIRALGLSERHVRETITELVPQLLTVDVNPAYDDDLRTYGFIKLLFELVLRYTSKFCGVEIRFKLYSSDLEPSPPPALEACLKKY